MKRIVFSTLLSFFLCSGLLAQSYGIVNLSVCNMRDKADFSSEMITQALMGMPVKILEDTKWYHIQTPEGYKGWVHHTGVHPVDKATYDAWNKAEKVVVTDHYGFVYSQPTPGAQPVSDVVSGNRLKLEGTQGNFYRVAYPDGRKGYLLKKAALTESKWKKQLKRDAASIIQTAFSLYGIPYLWAGASSKGVDCSGLVKTAFFLHGIILPRDASQQAVVGERIEIAPDFSNLRQGDLIFFGRRKTETSKERVVHVALYVGNKKFIHSQGDVHLSSFNPADKEYDAYNLGRLLFAGRVLNHLGEEGITPIEQNSFYMK